MTIDEFQECIFGEQVRRVMEAGDRAAVACPDEVCDGGEEA